MPFKLVCTQPMAHRKWGSFAHGQEVTNQEAVAHLTEHHERHFVRVPMTEAEVKAEAERKAKAEAENVVGGLSDAPAPPRDKYS